MSFRSLTLLILLQEGEKWSLPQYTHCILPLPENHKLAVAPGLFENLWPGTACLAGLTLTFSFASTSAWITWSKSFIFQTSSFVSRAIRSLTSLGNLDIIIVIRRLSYCLEATSNEASPQTCTLILSKINLNEMDLLLLQLAIFSSCPCAPLLLVAFYQNNFEGGPQHTTIIVFGYQQSFDATNGRVF